MPNVYLSDQATSVQRLSGLYLGHALTGKTEYLCSWPEPALVSFDPDVSTARKHKGVTIIEVSSWQDFEASVLPHIKARTLSTLCGGRPIQTVAIDTISVAAMRLSQHIQGRRDKLAIQDYGLLLTKLMDMVLACVGTTQEELGKPAYHSLFAAHLTDVTDDSGTLRGVRPAIVGQFKDLLPRLLGFTFLCERVMESVTEPGKPARMESRFQVRTVPPDRFHVCGDRIGGGRYKVLPPITSGYYTDLIRAWGMEA